MSTRSAVRWPPPFAWLDATEATLVVPPQAEADADALNRAATSALENRRYAHAWIAYRHAHERSGEPEAAIHAAAAAIRLGLLGWARDALRELRETEPTGYAHLHYGNALRYLGKSAEAGPALAAAYERARTRGDAILAIAADCAAGECALERAAPAEAVRSFGRALGLSELMPGEAASLPALAGLAEAHAAWRAPVKAREMAQRVVERAERVSDEAHLARALLARAGVAGRASDVRHAEALAVESVHVPLWVRSRARRAAIDRALDARARREGYDLALWAGMRSEAAALAPEEAR